MMTLRGWAALALFSLLLFAACGGGSEEAAPEPSAATEPRSGGTAVVGGITDPKNFNPYLGMSTAARGAQQRLYPALAYKDPGSPGGHRPGLAESWSFSEDGLTGTFRLADARWSDGKPITAADVRYTWTVQISPEVEWTSAATKDTIRDVEVVDPRTVVFHYDKRTPYQFEDTIDGLILPEHEFSKVPLSSWKQHDWTRPGVSGGPFRLVEYRAGDSLRFERNPEYFGPAPYLDEVLLRIVPERSNMVTQVRSGEMHYADGLSGRLAQPLIDNPELNVVEFPSSGFEFIAWNAKRAPFDDRRFRQAMTLALDREALVEELLYGKGTVVAGPFPAGTWEHDRTLEPWPYDPAEAGRLLDQLGWKLPADGGVRQKNGEPLTIEAMVQAGNDRREPVLIAAQAQFKKAGIDLRVVPLDMGALVERVRAFDYDAMILGWTFTGKVDIESLFASHRPGENNLTGYDSAEMNDLLDRAYGSESREEAKPLLDQIQQLLHRDQPYTFLFRADRIGISRRQLRGLARFDAADPLAPLDRAWLE